MATKHITAQTIQHPPIRQIFLQFSSHVWLRRMATSGYVCLCVYVYVCVSVCYVCLAELIA